MAARLTMAAIVAQMRLHGAAATDDEFNGVTYWTDDQLQAIADRNSRLTYLRLEQADLDGLIYRVENKPSIEFENDLTVLDSNQVPLDLTFTFNANTKELTFTEPLNTRASYYVFGRAIRIYDALAELWEVKASQRYPYIDWKAQNNRSNMRQEYENCVKQATFYRGKRVRSFSRTGVGEW